MSFPNTVGNDKPMNMNCVPGKNWTEDHEGAMHDVSKPKPSLKEVAAQISKENQINDLTRATGDRTVYKYYMQSIGWRKILAFVFFVTLHVGCSTFSRISLLTFPLLSLLKLTFIRSEIWLEWWATGNGTQKALYVTVYFILALFNSLGNGGYVW